MGYRGWAPSDRGGLSGGCRRGVFAAARREPADHPRPNFPVDLLCDPPSPPNPPWCHLPWRHGEGAADSIGVRVSEGHGGRPPWLMNSEYLGNLVGRPLWAKYRDNGWSQPGDRGTNMDQQSKQTDSQASLSASSSSQACRPPSNWFFHIGFLCPCLRYAALQFESLKGFQA